MYRFFVAEVKKQLCLKDWKYKDLAVKTGYSEQSIQAFMTGNRQSERMADAIAKVLEIER